MISQESKALLPNPSSESIPSEMSLVPLRASRRVLHFPAKSSVNFSFIGSEPSLCIPASHVTPTTAFERSARNFFCDEFKGERLAFNDGLLKDHRPKPLDFSPPGFEPLQLDIFTSRGLEKPQGDTQDDRRVSNNSAKSHYSVSEFDECTEP